MSRDCRQVEAERVAAAQVLQNYVRAIENQCHPEVEEEVPVSPHAGFGTKSDFEALPPTLSLPTKIVTVSQATRFAQDVTTFYGWTQTKQDVLTTVFEKVVMSTEFASPCEHRPISFGLEGGSESWPLESFTFYLSIVFSAENINAVDVSPEAIASKLSSWAKVHVDPKRVQITREAPNWGEPDDVIISIAPPSCKIVKKNN